MWQALLGILGAGVLGTAVYLIRRALGNSVALDERNAALTVESQRRAQLEVAAETARKQRLAELDAKVDAATDPAAIAGMLGDVTRPGGP